MYEAKIIFFASFISLTVFGQKTIERQQLVWYGYYNSLHLNSNWKLNNEIQERQFYNPTAQNQLVFRSNLKRNFIENLDISVGGAFFLQSSNNPNSKGTVTIPELRPEVSIETKQKIGFLGVNHRYKAEARFFHDIKNDKLVDGYRFSNFRFRYQLGFDFLIWKKENKDKIILKVKDEIMINVGNKIVKNTFDQNRIYVALNYKLDASYAFELGYMNWFQQQKTGVDFYNRNILRLSFFHTIDLKKKNNE